MSDHIIQTYGRLPVAFVRGAGAQLWDDKGEVYLDALSGIAVCGLGHAHPQLARAISQQAQTLIHTSNLYHIPLQQQLAERLCRLAGMDAAFFANSGAEANEAAIKIARLYGHQKGYQQPQIITTHKSFHGRTLSTLSATGNPRIQKGFSPLLPGFQHVAYNDVDAIKNCLAHTEEVVAIMVEPVQGEGGVHIPDADYLQQIRRICDQHDVIMILDEIQTGICRTGKWFAFQHHDIQPDIITLAKGLGNGVPIGACLARGQFTEVFTPGTHGSTFGGNPLSCAAALATLESMQAQQINDRVTQLGEYFSNSFANRLGHLPQISDIRIKGLMIGIELDKNCTELVKLALEKYKLLINVTADRVIRLLPPFIISDEQAKQIVEAICSLIEDFYQNNY